MHRETHTWFSAHLQQEMALNIYGHWGAPIIVFPCSRGRYFDYEGLVARDKWSKVLEAGKVYDNYERIKSESGGIIDYADMIFLAHRLLKDHKMVGATLRQRYKY